MNPFIVLFSLITLFSIMVSGALLLLRRRGGGRWRTCDHINPCIFSFFTTLYAFFIGFAIVTLWSAFLTAKNNMIQEADALLIAYRTADNLPGGGPLRQGLINYVKSVIEQEWPTMEQDSMSPEAIRRFEALWSDFSELKGNQSKTDAIYAKLAEAGRQRALRAAVLKGNIYPPVWVILFFGVISVIFGLYFINREPTLVALIYEFMVIFLLLSCIYFVVDIDTPFSGLVIVKPSAFQVIYQQMLSHP